jgi:hypothetical protein
MSGPPRRVAKRMASVKHGYWYSRSSDFLGQGLMLTLRWLRMPGGHAVRHRRDRLRGLHLRPGVPVLPRKARVARSRTMAWPIRGRSLPADGRGRRELLQVPPGLDRRRGLIRGPARGKGERPSLGQHDPPSPGIAASADGLASGGPLAPVTWRSDRAPRSRLVQISFGSPACEASERPRLLAPRLPCHSA